MRLLRRVLAVCSIMLSTAAVAVAGAVPAQAAAAARLPSSPSAAAAGRRIVLVDCAGHGLVRPRTFVLACADGNDYLARLRWARWGATSRGRGNDWVNSCVPDCVQGKFHRYPVRVRAWRARPRPDHASQRYLSRLTLTFTKRVPKGFRRRTVYRLLPSI